MAEEPDRQPASGGSLRRRLLLVLLPCLLPAWLLAGYVAWSSARDVRAVALNDLQDAAAGLAADAEREIAGLRGMLLALGGAPMMVGNDIAAIHARLTELRRDAGTEVVLLTAAGQKLVNTRRALGDALPMTNETRAHARAVETGELQLTGVFPSVASGRPLVAIHLPLRGPGGGVERVLSVSTEVDRHWSRLVRQQAMSRRGAGQGEMALLDGTGAVIAAVPDGGAGLAAGYRQALEPAAFAVIMADGQPGRAVALPTARGAWVAVVALPEAALAAPLGPVLWLGLALALGGGLAAFLLARNITRPLAALRMAAQELGRTGRMPDLPASGLPEADALVAALQNATDARAIAEEALTHREGELRRVQRIGRVGGYRIDLTGGRPRNLRSPEYLELHGLTPEDGDEAHAGWVARLHPDDREATNRAFWEAVRPNGPTSYAAEYRILRADGQLRSIFAVAEIERDAATGEALAMVGAHIDVTKLRRAQAEATTNAERFRGLAEAMPQLAWSATATGAAEWFSPRWQEATGATAEALAGEGWFDLVHPQDRARALSGWRLCVAQKSSWEAELRLRCVTSGGEDEWRLHLARCLRPKGDAGWYGTCTDIEALKRVDATLAEERIRLRLALDAARAGLWTYDPVADALQRDDAALLALLSPGLPAHSTMAAALEDCVHPEDRPAVLRGLRAALDPAGDGRLLFTHRLLTDDGVPRWIEVRGQAVFDPGPPRRAIRLQGIAMEVAPKVADMPPTAAASALARPAAPARILVVEDDAMLAMDTARLLRQAGCTVVGPVGTLAEALRLAREEALDGAILDLNLHGEGSHPVAEALAQRSVPFVVVTGYDGLPAGPGLGDALAAAPLLTKPCPPERLRAMVLGLIQDKG